MDLKSLADEDLDSLRKSVQIERERRDNLSRIPGEIAAMAAKYRDGGGDEDALAVAISEKADPFDGGFDLYDVDEETITH